MVGGRGRGQLDRPVVILDLLKEEEERESNSPSLSEISSHGVLFYPERRQRPLRYSLVPLYNLQMKQGQRSERSDSLSSMPLQSRGLQVW